MSVIVLQHDLYCYLFAIYVSYIEQNWAACKSLLNIEVLKKDVLNFNLTYTNPEIACRCLRMLQPHKFEDILEISTVAACFYAWVSGLRIIWCS